MKKYKITEKNGKWKNFKMDFMKPIDEISSIIFKDHTTVTYSEKIAEYFKQRPTEYIIEETDEK